MRIEKIKNLNCFCDFSHSATIRTDSGRSLGTTCDPEEAEKIIRGYFKTECLPETVHVFFGGGAGQNGIWGYTFKLK